MPIVRIIFTDKVEESHGLLQILHDRLQEVIASELSTSDVKLNSDSVELVFEKGHSLNRGKDLKILVDGNDFLERTKNIQERSDRIAKGVGDMLFSSYRTDRNGFVYVTLQVGGLGKFHF